MDNLIKFQITFDRLRHGEFPNESLQNVGVNCTLIEKIKPFKERWELELVNDSNETTSNYELVFELGLMIEAFILTRNVS